MFDFVFQHRRNVANVGDLHCSPAEYFDFGHQHVMDLQDDAPACNTVVLGGGNIFGRCIDAVIYRTSLARHRVIWGVGITPAHRRDISFDIVAPNCALISTRNFGVPDIDYVPCASAMSPLFDNPPAPRHAVVMLRHARQSRGFDCPTGIPDMTNRDVTLPQVIAHIASGETVVTDSYHGTYWAMLLGRKVLCVPFNDKFRHFRQPPVFARSDDWRDRLQLAETRPDLLDEARRLNQAFYQRVINL